ncbi:MAG: sulfatase [Phaeodactylibacter sp.]|uniref:sulfatase family protein n=1 Tax=Phaeodactylibacter sp. TaxID=1940289 RepID=UPI0032EFDBD2
MNHKTPIYKAGVVFFFLLLTAIAFAQPNEKQRPNVVFIYADDLGYGDLGCYGADSIHTPHLDELAANGVRYTDFYSTSPICSPSRAGLLTGQYPIRNGIGPVFFPWSKGGLDTATFTMAELFKAQGYATACIGKWHLGHQPQHHPSQHGFDYFFGLRYSNDMDWPRPWKPNYKPKQLLALYRDTTIIDQPVHQPTLTQRYTAEAIQFVAKHQEEPFFLYWPHTFPHEPLFVSAEFEGTSKYGLYGDVVQELDNSVGELLKALEDFGLSDNTIIVFSSDNGARQVPQRWGNKETCGSNAPLRGRKQTTFEGGIRVPAIAYGKGYFEGGEIISTPGIMCDWLPTFVAITGYTLPRELKLNGTDLLKLKPTTERDFFFYRFDQLNAIRSGPWKLKLANPDRARGEPMPHEDDLLFNLVQDPGEQRNLANQYPDKVAELKARIAAFEASIAPLPPLQK